MAELTISPDEIRDALETFVSNFKPTPQRGTRWAPW